MRNKEKETRGRKPQNYKIVREYLDQYEFDEVVAQAVRMSFEAVNNKNVPVTDGEKGASV